MLRDDRIRLRHMLDAAKEAIRFAQGRKRSDLDHDRMLILALTKDIEILGEAASKVSDNGREELPELPWLSMIAMRNRLIHGYFDIDLDRVWDTIETDLPPLIVTLEKALPSEE